MSEREREGRMFWKQEAAQVVRKKQEHVCRVKTMAAALQMRQDVTAEADGASSGRALRSWLGL